MPIFIFPHYKSMATTCISCQSNQGSYLTRTGTKKREYYSLPLPVNVICEIWQESASEKMLFENADADDGCLPIL